MLRKEITDLPNSDQSAPRRLEVRLVDQFEKVDPIVLCIANQTYEFIQHLKDTEIPIYCLFNHESL